MKNKKLVLLLTVIFALSVFPMFGYATSGNQITASAENRLTEQDVKYAFGNMVLDQIHYIFSCPADFGFNDTQLMTAYFGKPFIATRVNEDNTLTSDDNIMYYPIYSGSNIIAIMALVKDQGNVFCNIGKAFSSELAESMSTSLNNKTAVFTNNKGLFAINDNDEVYPLQSLVDGAVLDIKKSGKVKFEKMNIESSTVSSLNATPTKSIQDVAASMAIIQTIGEHNLSNYPKVSQVYNGVQHGMCWAAVIASMAEFELPSQYPYPTLTAANVCDTMGIGYDAGTSLEGARTALTHYFKSPYVPTKYTRVLTNSEITTVINNVDPAYMNCYKTTGGNDHAVALCGYNEGTSSMTIRVMNPGINTYGDFQTVSNSGGIWELSYGGSTYRWYQTVRLLYN